MSRNLLLRIWPSCRVLRFHPSHHYVLWDEQCAHCCFASGQFVVNVQKLSSTLFEKLTRLVISSALVWYLNVVDEHEQAASPRHLRFLLPCFLVVRNALLQFSATTYDNLYWSIDRRRKETLMNGAFLFTSRFRPYSMIPMYHIIKRKNHVDNRW